MIGFIYMLHSLAGKQEPCWCYKMIPNLNHVMYYVVNELLRLFGGEVDAQGLGLSCALFKNVAHVWFLFLSSHAFPYSLRTILAMIIIKLATIYYFF